MEIAITLKKNIHYFANSRNLDVNQLIHEAKIQFD